MPYYRVYFVGADGHFTSAADFHLNDDQSAIEAAQEVARGHKVELWSGRRHIADINTDDMLKT
jgi:hypothetical protein